MFFVIHVKMSSSFCPQTCVWFPHQLKSEEPVRTSGYFLCVLGKISITEQHYNAILTVLKRE